MICSGCGIDLQDNVVSCPYCGTKNEYAKVEHKVVKGDLKVWQIFAAISGFISFINVFFTAISLVSIFSWIIIAISIFTELIVLNIGVLGIIFGALGMKSIVSHDKAKTALILNIITYALSFILFIITMSVFVFSS